uniref:Coiled-coil domain-containing protein 114-like isoform X2 n=1 Tax=Petromyzon marinus TaxID=7757 RepID=A0AAJ7TM73_PETMA|nr:coiled-coil domain-containing protein 114-like isoform X2 [Petromyzon marinus]
MSPERSSSRRQDSADRDSDAEGEKEYLSLVQQQRRLQSEQRVYKRESTSEIRKQMQELSRLEEERKTTLQKLAVAASHRGQRYSAGRVASLLARNGHLDEQIEQELQRQQMLDDQIRAMEKNLERKRAAPVKQRHLQSKIHNASTRLDTTNTKLGEQLTENGRLRGDIDTLRCERDKFLVVHSKLDKELKDLKKEMKASMEAASEAHQSREDAQAKLSRVREQNEKEVEMFHAEMRELRLASDHEGGLQRFLLEKDKRRVSPDELERSQRKLDEARQKRSEEQREAVARYDAASQQIAALLEADGSPGGGGGTGSPRGGRVAKGSLAELSDADVRRLQELAGMSRRRSVALPAFLHASAGTEAEGSRRTHRRMSTLALALGLDDGEGIREAIRRSLEKDGGPGDRSGQEVDGELFYSKFMEREENNFALYNYVSEQSAAIQQLNGEIHKLMTELHDGRRSDAERDSRLGEEARLLEERARDASREADRLSGDNRRRRRMGSQLQSEIGSLLSHIGGSEGSAGLCFGHGEDLLEQVVMTTLGRVEQRANELLTARAYQHYQGADAVSERGGSTWQLLSLSPPTQAANFDLELPSTKLVSGSDSEGRCSDDEQLLTDTELREKALQSVLRQETKE